MNKYPTPTFFECYKMFFKYAINFSARSRRAEYGKAAFINWTIFVNLSYILSVIRDIISDNFYISSYDLWDLNACFQLVIFLFLVIIFIPSCSLIIRRAHDCGISSWNFIFILVGIVTLCIITEIGFYSTIFVSCIPLFALFFIDSKPEENEWGVSAKYYDDSDAE